ncbi:hypothetical protein [Sphingomonas japonica]|uniref:Preprotein translocase subunit YajC n=1 Tax=Sphingomonas japonica TaxID=511662 RepID=A0ABX0U5R4_9SPHN|nr:hypothetical protein [Sphingomonas japonica]NIJ24597.1 hypothetical protein [Sphingomonas japonica]
MIAIAAALSVSAAAAQTRTPIPTPAPQAAATPTVGAMLYDPQGIEAGTIDSIQPNAIIVSTGTAKVAVPTTAVGPGEKGLVVSLTKAQLNAAAAQAEQQAQAALQAQLVPGAQVRGANGTTVLGTVKSAGANIVLTTPKGDVSLAPSAFGMSPRGIIVGLTPEQFDAAVTGAQTGAAPAAASTATPAADAATQ